MLGSPKPLSCTREEFIRGGAFGEGRQSWRVVSERKRNYLNAILHFREYPVIGLEHHHFRAVDFCGEFIEAGWYHWDIHYPFVDSPDDHVRIPAANAAVREPDVLALDLLIEFWQISFDDPPQRTLR